MNINPRMMTLFIALPLFLSLSLAGQNVGPQIDARMNEGMAKARSIAASKNSSVTTQLCTADLSRWGAMDVADEKAKTDPPNFWYEKLSTEELLRLAAESRKCTLITTPRDHVRMFQFCSRSEEFDLELRLRAESILADHGLYHTYLLTTSR